MKLVIATFLSLILVAMSTRIDAQESMTVEQLLGAGNNEDRAFAAAMYITGWKEGTGIQLAIAAQDLRTTASPVALERAARLQTLSDCLMYLGVADLAAGLNASMRNNSISPATPAMSALRVAMEEACPRPPGQDD